MKKIFVLVMLSFITMSIGTSVDASSSTEEYKITGREVSEENLKDIDSLGFRSISITNVYEVYHHYKSFNVCRSKNWWQFGKTITVESDERGYCPKGYKFLSSKGEYVESKFDVVEGYTLYRKEIREVHFDSINDSLKNGTTKSKKLIHRRVDSLEIDTLNLYQQNYNSKLGKSTDTISRSGCLLTSATMLINAFKNTELTPPETNLNLVTHKEGWFLWYSPGKYGLETKLSHGTTPGRTSKISFNDTEEFNKYKDNVIEELIKGKLVIGKVQGARSHYVLVKGFTEEGKLIIADPASKSRQFFIDLKRTYSRFNVGYAAYSKK